MERNERIESNAERRHRDFMAECSRQIRLMSQQNEELKIRDIVSRAIVSGAPEYYVDYDYAVRHVRRLIESGETRGGGCRGQMMIEIASRVKRITDRGKLGVDEALQRVLAQGGASSYFMTVKYGIRLYHHCRSCRLRPAERLRGRRLI